MQARFILGPAGSGKTFRCLAEIRAALAADPDGPPLILLAPKQSTYQLERQLLAAPTLAGYTRLHILSFERLAFFLLDRCGVAAPRLLDEEGRLMVLRSLLARRREELQLFRASARLTGFAQQLSAALRELQTQQLTPDHLRTLAAQLDPAGGLPAKLTDLATLLDAYLGWLEERGLRDADQLLPCAARALHQAPAPLGLGGLWLEGFGDLTPAELQLLGLLLPHTTGASFTFCLDEIPTEPTGGTSPWSAPRHNYWRCRRMIRDVPGVELVTELLPRRADRQRFAGNPVLRHLETHWARPEAYAPAPGEPAPESVLRLVTAANPEAEAVVAAREILRFVRAGGRYREVGVITRRLEAYHDALGQAFQRYGIPCFLDRREAVAHHPLAELTRNALRTVAGGWQTEDWFAALKTGLAPATEEAIDQLENEALARGWKGAAWEQPLATPERPALAETLEPVRRRVVPPFAELGRALQRHSMRPTGPQLATALRRFWGELNVPDTLREWSEQDARPQPIHATVWEQMGAWLDNVELAFPTDALPVREWLPILDAGLANLSVGVIPPALDQVLVGAIDRSRNPELRLALVLGLNEGGFPAAPTAAGLLTEHDRTKLAECAVELPGGRRQQLAWERHFGYLALTRSRGRLVLLSARTDAAGKTLNPSPFLTTVRRLFPSLPAETAPRLIDWRETEHPTELAAALLQAQESLAAGGADDATAAGVTGLLQLPALTALREELAHFHRPPAIDTLAPALAERLYGRDLRTSVSRLEQFAACPFRFFVHSGLRAEERRQFEVDVRDHGNFQHDALAQFHEGLQAEGRRWRDLTPAEARERIRVIASALALGYRAGLLQAGAQNRFTARVLTESLQDFVAVLTGWMRGQYAFDPAAVELPFGDEAGAFPPWRLDLAEGRRVLLQGRIDRVDLHRGDAGDADMARCVVVDYKSSQKRLDPVLLAHGLQLQLAAYLNVLRHWPDPRRPFGVGRLLPAGVFYVNLRGQYPAETSRAAALADPDRARRRAYQHSGRFDAAALPLLDQRPDAPAGDQFAYKRKQDGELAKTNPDAMTTADFGALLDQVETTLRRMGEAVFAGAAAVDPYRHGAATACDHCDYASVCRVDPWTHPFRVLRASAPATGAGAAPPEPATAA